MNRNWMPLGVMAAAVAVALTVGACSGHGGGTGTCVETMQGMIMCPTTTNDQVVPSVRVAH